MTVHVSQCLIHYHMFLVVTFVICSFLRVSKHLPVSPTYHKTQSTQSILYSILPSKAVDLIFFFKLFSKRTLHPSHPLCASINSFVITYIITNVLSHLLTKYFAKINKMYAIFVSCSLYVDKQIQRPRHLGTSALRIDTK